MCPTSSLKVCPICPRGFVVGDTSLGRERESIPSIWVWRWATNARCVSGVGLTVSWSLSPIRSIGCFFCPSCSTVLWCQHLLTVQNRAQVRCKHWLHKGNHTNMKGCMDHIHLAIKVSKPKVNLACRLLFVVPAKVVNQSKPILWWGLHSIWSNPIWSGPMHVHSPLSPPSYCHYARIFNTER
jgi:hypothetical protein